MPSVSQHCARLRIRAAAFCMNEYATGVYKAAEKRCWPAIEKIIMYFRRRRHHRPVISTARNGGNRRRRFKCKSKRTLSGGADCYGASSRSVGIFARLFAKLDDFNLTVACVWPPGEGQRQKWKYRCEQAGKMSACDFGSSRACEISAGLHSRGRYNDII